MRDSQQFSGIPVVLLSLIFRETLEVQLCTHCRFYALKKGAILLNFIHLPLNTTLMFTMNNELDPAPARVFIRTLFKYNMIEIQPLMHNEM